MSKDLDDGNHKGFCLFDMMPEPNRIRLIKTESCSRGSEGRSEATVCLNNLSRPWCTCTVGETRKDERDLRFSCCEGHGGVGQ